jgi:defect-in-organelle-trafficking protein DotB
LQNAKPALILADGDMIAITNFRFQTEQIEHISSIIAEGQNLTTALASGRDFDHAFGVEDQTQSNEHGVPKRLRFRLSATAITGRDANSKQLIMRHIPADPPRLEDITFPESLIGEIGLQQGTFLIAGETGSGKTTTFAACLRYISEGKTPIRGNIVTYEAPVEYVFTDMPTDFCVIAQSEIGVHLPSFADGVRNAMRRKPSLIVVGEMRDQETIRAANDAAITGHPLYGTVHANNSAVIVRRMISQYDMTHQTQAFADIIMNTRILMSQTLVKRVGGGRVCLRDWMIIDPKRRELLMKAGPADHVLLMQEWMESGDKAQSMRTSIAIEKDAGNISDEVEYLALKRYGYVE